MSNFWELDILTAPYCGGSTILSVTDSRQKVDGDNSTGALYRPMSREIANCRSKVVFGSWSSHIAKQHRALRNRTRPRRRALATRNRRRYRPTARRPDVRVTGQDNLMPTEHAAVRVVHKPWGVGDLQPWSSVDGSGDAVGELWFERADKNAPTPALLLKLLFTSEPLSIQVHPDDTFARAMGMPNGKSEAWYILSAEPDAQIGVGLKHQVTPQQLRASIQRRFDRRTRSLAPGCERRRHLHPGRHHPCHRRRHRAG